ncbi:hypothetical protein FKR81_25965 [Lentzea tibetensis]|uniref:Uncharacterized protein n=1 Tax=Lentzea tibetensis TaxID=2591470 RepID=A0A563EPA9_9PSEU|nr:hypothetical protein [Lentzea tibetensis]TWP49116.1 hypothetical protein FKR81_25965 [Lentzea tibetensis]
MGERKAVTRQLTRRYQTPFQRTCADPTVDVCDKSRLHGHYLTLNPAAVRREIHAVTDALATEVTKTFSVKPYRRLSAAGIPHEATTPPTRAS